MRRFYVPKENFKAQTIVLDQDETRHLKNVLRLSSGDEIGVFDGDGREFSAVIETIEKKKASLRIIKEIPPASPESDFELTLAAALLKGDKFELVLQKAVELGVTRFVPLVTHRGDVRLKNPDVKLERWRKIIVEASKQCGRAKLLELDEPLGFEEFLETESEQNGNIVLFAERDGESAAGIKTDKKLTVVIGPEGGWEDSEIELGRKNGATVVTLGGRILRAETAVIAVAAILQHRFGDLN